MKTTVFFSRSGQGFFKASLPEKIKNYHYDAIVDWAANEKIEKGYYGFFVTNHPDANPNIQE